MERIYHIKPTASGMWECSVVGTGKDEVLFKIPCPKAAEEVMTTVALKMERARIIVHDALGHIVRERAFHAASEVAAPSLFH